MTINKCREVINNIKDELRDQVSLWDYQLMHDRAMNLSLQRKAENAIEKSKILQKLRIRHAEKLLRDLESGPTRRKESEKDIQNYWSAIVPDINDALESFREINHLRKFETQIRNVEVRLSLSQVLARTGSTPTRMALATSAEFLDGDGLRHRATEDQVPEELDIRCASVSPEDSEPEIKSVMTYVARGSNDSTSHSVPTSASHTKTPTKRSKSGNKVSRK